MGEEAEEIAALNLAKFRKAQQELEDNPAKDSRAHPCTGPLSNPNTNLPQISSIKSEFKVLDNFARYTRASFRCKISFPNPCNIQKTKKKILYYTCLSFCIGGTYIYNMMT